MRWATRNFCGWRDKFENFGGIEAINFWRNIDLQKKERLSRTMLGNFGEFTAVKSVLSQKNIFTAVSYKY